MQRITHWVDDLVACDDGEMPDDLFDRIVALGEKARAKLVELATDPVWRGDAADGGGLAPFHALEVLAALPPDDATSARLVASIVEDPGAAEVDDLVTCLAAAGPVAVPHLLAALAATRSSAAAPALCEALAFGDTRDETVFAALLAAFARFPGDVAPSLAEYGDERAVSALHSVLGLHFVGAGSSEDSDEDALTLAQAIVDLGGELSEDEETKRDLAERRQARRTARVAAQYPDAGDAPAAAAPPRPNDPCPCGSGRKFKKCHEGAADLGGGTDDAERLEP